MLSLNARKQERYLSGLFPFPTGSQCGISKQVNAATKTMNNIMAYERTSKPISMRISLTKDPVFEAITTGVALSVLLASPSCS